MINKITQVKLNVRPIFIGLQHLYQYEGPCRFGKGEELEPAYDAMMNQELYRSFKEDVAQNMPECVNLMDPIYVERDDWFLSREEMFETMAKDMEQVDFYLFSFGIGRGDIYVEFARRYHKPQGVMPYQCCEAAVNTSAVRNRGLEAYAFRNWEDLRVYMRVLRTRKALASTRVLVASRFNSARSYSSSDNFVDLEQISTNFGVEFRYISAHELLDQMHVVDPTTNPTLPGRKANNLTEEDMVEVERMADELIAGAQECRMERDMVVNSIKAYYTVQKLLDVYGCNAFTIPCPDICSTRRLNQEKVTFCLTHSLNNEQGIPSACELDLNALLGLTVMESLTGQACYMGNTNAVMYRDGKMVPLQGFSDEDLKHVTDARENLMLIFHSVPNRKLKGFDSQPGSYGLAPFAHSGFGATIRYDFSQDAGQEITLCRFAPDGKRLMVASAKIVAGSGYDRVNCDQGFFFQVENQEDFFYKQINFGNHMVVAYGDHRRELGMLGQALGLEVVYA